MYVIMVLRREQGTARDYLGKHDISTDLVVQPRLGYRTSKQATQELKLFPSAP